MRQLFRTFALLLTGLLTVPMLTGCGGDDDEDEEGLTDSHISDEMTNAQKSDFREKLGVSDDLVTFVEEDDVAVSGNRITLSVSLGLSSLRNGIGFRFKTEATNTDTPEIVIHNTDENTNFSARDLVRVDGSDIEAGELPNGEYITIIYDAATSEFWSDLRSDIPDGVEPILIFTRDIAMVS